jgi:hypothetical protein
VSIPEPSYELRSRERADRASRNDYRGRHKVILNIGGPIDAIADGYDDRHQEDRADDSAELGHVLSLRRFGDGIKSVVAYTLVGRFPSRRSSGC